MRDNYSVAPLPPWFKVSEHPHVPKVTTQDENNHTIDLPYIHYTLMNEEPMMVGTTAKDALVYGETLQALPAPPPLFISHIDNSMLEDLYKDYPFNWAINLALMWLGNRVIQGSHLLATYPVTYFTTYLIRKTRRRAISGIINFDDTYSHCPTYCLTYCPAYHATSSKSKLQPPCFFFPFFCIS